VKRGLTRINKNGQLFEFSLVDKVIKVTQPALAPWSGQVTQAKEEIL
jgi:hypothetical protein